jgi:hypothetical protein
MAGARGSSLPPLDKTIPSPAELGRLFRTNIRPESLVLSDAVTATFDLSALKGIASTTMGNECTDVIKISEGEIHFLSIRHIPI